MQAPSVKSDDAKEALACFNGIGGHAKEAAAVAAVKPEAPMIEAAAAEALACFNGIGGHGKVAE